MRDHMYVSGHIFYIGHSPDPLCINHRHGGGVAFQTHCNVCASSQDRSKHSYECAPRNIPGGIDLIKQVYNLYSLSVFTKPKSPPISTMSAIPISDMDENKDVSSCTVLRVYQWPEYTCIQPKTLDPDEGRWQSWERHTERPQGFPQRQKYVWFTRVRLMSLWQLSRLIKESSITSPFCDQLGSEFLDDTKAKVWFSLVEGGAKDKV